MVTIAYEEEGDEENHLKGLVVLGELPRARICGLSLQGMGTDPLLPQQALENLRKACDIRPKSQVAKMFYATALWYDAIQLANPHEGLEQANEAIRILGVRRIPTRSSSRTS